MRPKKRRPEHPGTILKRQYLKPLSLTVTGLAETLGVSQKALSKITNEGGAVTPDMALRLSKAFNTTPELWLNLQRNYNLFKLSKANVELKKTVSRFKATVKLIVEDDGGDNDGTES